jgi:hypothetical protein
MVYGCLGLAVSRLDAGHRLSHDVVVPGALASGTAPRPDL